MSSPGKQAPAEFRRVCSQRVPLDSTTVPVEGFLGETIDARGSVEDNKIVMEFSSEMTGGMTKSLWIEGCKLHVLLQDTDMPECQVSVTMRRQNMGEAGESSEECAEDSSSRATQSNVDQRVHCCCNSQTHCTCTRAAVREAPKMAHTLSVIDQNEPALSLQQAQVRELLKKEWPKSKNTSLSNVWEDRDNLIRQAGPAMVLMDAQDIERLGRIPAHAEQQHISMAEAKKRADAKGLRFFVDFFSHRWHSATQPDDDKNSQANALVEWAKYRAACGLASFFWIDYSCVDQTNVAPGIVMLPLYVATSNNILCFSGGEYEQRAWCRLERALFASFGAPTQDFIGPGFKYSGNPKRQRVVESYKSLNDPEHGVLSYSEDMPKVAALNLIAKQHWGQCWKQGLYDAVKTKMPSVHTLVYGTTQVRNRCFT